MKKTISTNQTSLIMVIFTIALKLSVLPAITCDFSSTSAYIVVLFACIIDFLLTLAIIIIMQKIPDKNFFGLIRDTLSKPVAIIVYVFLFAYFFLKLLITLLELHDYYIVTLFEHLNPFFFILALMSLLLYLFKAEFRAIGRMIEICFWPLALGIAFTLIYPIAEVELVNLFPLFEDGMYPIMNGLIRTSFAYGDFMILFVLMGNISYSKHARKKILLYMSAVLGFVFNFYIIFVGTFGDTAVNQSLALSELPLHNPYPTTIGRLEWLTIIMWSAILLIQVAVLGISCTTCFKEIFGLADRKIPTYVIIFVLSVLYIPTYLKLDQVIKFSTNEYFSLFSKGFEILCVIILYISYFLLMKRKKPFETNIKVGKSNAKHPKKALSQ